MPAEVGESGIIVNEWRACESNAVKVEDNVDGIDGARLVADFHAAQYDFIEEANKAPLGLRELCNKLRQPENKEEGGEECGHMLFQSSDTD